MSIARNLETGFKRWAVVGASDPTMTTPVNAFCSCIANRAVICLNCPANPHPKTAIKLGIMRLPPLLASLTVLFSYTPQAPAQTCEAVRIGIGGDRHTKIRPSRAPMWERS
jgi:hypothetical protein